MARLIFFDDTHTYTVDGEEFPSVSEISRFASREVYGEVSQYNLDNACSRGSAVHKATEILDKYGKCECEEDIEPYIRAYVKFRKDFGIKDYAHIEKSLAHEELKYAGTIDRIYTIDEKFVEAVAEKCKKFVFINSKGNVEAIKIPQDLKSFIGSLAIIDLKSSSVVQNVLALIQLNGYKLSTEFNGIGEVGALFILHLENDGNYKLIGFEINTDLFMACLTLHKALQKKKRVKKENTENE
ncbi:MAG: hypothetical protein J6J71_04700 [Prevotella sp.]|nr:hypothetical protein [Prevotella sp.]